MCRPGLWGFGFKVIVVQRASLMNGEKKLVAANNMVEKTIDSSKNRLSNVTSRLHNRLPTL